MNVLNYLPIAHTVSTGVIIDQAYASGASTSVARRGRGKQAEVRAAGVVVITRSGAHRLS